MSCFPRAGFTQTYRQNAQTCDGMGLLKIWQAFQVSPPSVEISTLATPTSFPMAQPVTTKFSPEICSLFRGSSMTDCNCRSPVFDHPIHSQYPRWLLSTNSMRVSHFGIFIPYVPGIMTRNGKP